MQNQFLLAHVGKAVCGLFYLWIIWAGIFLLTQNADAAQLCSRDPEGRHFTEAKLLREEKFSNRIPGDLANRKNNYSKNLRKKYEAWIIGCNRKNDSNSKEIEDRFRASDRFEENISPRTVKGHFNYQGNFILRQRYAYQLEREDKRWIVTVPIKFDWPDERMTDMVDIPTELAVNLQLNAPDKVCAKGKTQFRSGNSRRVEKGFIDWEFTPDQLAYIHEWQDEHGAAKNLSVTESIFSRQDYENLPKDAHSRSIFSQDWWDIAINSNETSCRVSRSLNLVNPRAAADGPKSILGHLRDFWKRKLPAYWNLPGQTGRAFEVHPRMIGCEGDNQRYGCDPSTSRERSAWDKDETTWIIRFNLRPMSRAKYKSNPIALNNMYTGAASWVFAHELGHQLGLDDEYSWTGNANRDCGAILPVDAAGNGGAENQYLMCDQTAGRAGMQGVYAWIITRRNVIARKFQCKENRDCGDDQFCAKNGLNRNTCEQKRPNGETCTQKKQCQSGRCYWGQCKPQDACTKDYECDRDQYCDKGTVSFGVNKCKADRERGKACIRKEQCISNRCNWGRCARPK